MVSGKAESVGRGEGGRVTGNVVGETSEPSV